MKPRNGAKKTKRHPHSKRIILVGPHLKDSESSDTEEASPPPWSDSEAEALLSRYFQRVVTIERVTYAHLTTPLHDYARYLDRVLPWIAAQGWHPRICQDPQLWIMALVCWHVPEAAAEDADGRDGEVDRSGFWLPGTHYVWQWYGPNNKVVLKAHTTDSPIRPRALSEATLTPWRHVGGIEVSSRVPPPLCACKVRRLNKAGKEINAGNGHKDVRRCLAVLEDPARALRANRVVLPVEMHLNAVRGGRRRGKKRGVYLVLLWDPVAERYRGYVGWMGSGFFARWQARNTPGSSHFADINAFLTGRTAVNYADAVMACAIADRWHVANKRAFKRKRAHGVWLIPLEYTQDERREWHWIHVLGTLNKAKKPEHFGLNVNRGKKQCMCTQCV